MVTTEMQKEQSKYVNNKAILYLALPTFVK